jgi:steroid delta-isomerase-like uncharacterized protein
VVVAAVSLLSCQAQPAGVMSQEEARAFVERGLPIWNEGRLELVDELYTPGFVRHDVGVGDDVVGLEALKGYVMAMRTGYPDFQVAIEEVLVAGDRVINRWIVTGTNLGDFRGDPPTGGTIEVHGVGISRIIDGRSAEEWNYWNDLAGYLQLGYSLEPPKAEETAE